MDLQCKEDMLLRVERIRHKKSDFIAFQTMFLTPDEDGIMEWQTLKKVIFATNSIHDVIGLFQEIIEADSL